MSRVGKKPIPVPSGVTVQVSDASVEVKGPKGTFTQKMLRFEEFGTRPLDQASGSAMPFPQPVVGPYPAQDPIDSAKSGPSPAKLDEFLREPGFVPYPTEFSNTIDKNPWEPDIERFLGRALDTPPAEGRPPGRGWAHQRWSEFYPVEFFKTAQVGAQASARTAARAEMTLMPFFIPSPP